MRHVASFVYCTVIVTFESAVELDAFAPAADVSSTKRFIFMFPVLFHVYSFLL